MHIFFDPLTNLTLPDPNEYQVTPHHGQSFIITPKHQPHNSQLVDIGENIPHGTCSCDDFVHRWLNEAGQLSIPTGTPTGCKHIRLINFLQELPQPDIHHTVVASPTHTCISTKAKAWLAKQVPTKQ